MIGTIIAGRYRIESVLGRGGMGTVYRATGDGGKTVALKILNQEVAEVEHFRDRFAGEIEITNQVVHPHIVQFRDWGNLVTGELFLVMEVLEGQSLGEVLDNEQRLDVYRALRIGYQLLDALSAVHKAGFIHRDLKPDNIFLVPRQDGVEMVKLFDFGLAKPLDPGRRELTQPGFAIGTPTYIAPERLVGSGADHRSDLYALGVLLFEMVSGAPPFGGEGEELLRGHVGEEPPLLSETVAPLGISVPPPVEAVIQRALSKAPEDRFQSADEFAAAIDDFFNTEFAPTVATAAAPDVPWYQQGGTRALQLFRSRTGAVIAGLVATMLILVIILLRRDPAPAQPVAEPEEAEPAEAAPGAAMAQMDAIIEIMRSRSADSTDFPEIEIDALFPGRCRRGAVNRLDVIVCAFPKAGAAAAAESVGMSLLGETTGVSFSRDSTLIVVADPDQVDPEGRDIQRLVDLLQAESP